MSTLRFLFILLLILNGLAFAATGGWLELRPPPHGEPDRILNQLNPERIRLAARSSRETPASAATQETPAPAAAPENAVCAAWSGLSADEADKLASRLAEAGLSPRRSSTETPGATWWVRIPPQGSRDGAERKAKELRALGVTDLFIVQEAGPSQFAVSLGIFRTEAAANQQLAQLRTRGVRSADVEMRSAPQYRIEVTAPPARIAAAEGNGTQHRAVCLP